MATEPHSNQGIVLGNGPSLKECLENHIDVLNGRDRMVVNIFCFSPYLEKLKPKYYILADPRYFY